VANVKISDLGAVGTAATGDLHEISQGGVSYKATTQQVVDAGLKAPGPIGGTTPNTAVFSGVQVNELTQKMLRTATGSVGAGGTIAITIGRSTLMVVCCSVNPAGANVRTHRIYFVGSFDSDATSIQQLGADATGSGGGSAFTLTESGGVLTMTNTSGGTRSMSMTCFGGGVTV